MASTIQSGAFYVLMNVSSHTVADLDDGNPSDGTVIRGWNISFDSAAANQVWKFLQDGDGWRIVNSSSKTNWDLNGGEGGNGVKIQGWNGVDGDGNVNQRWDLTQVSGSGPKQICRWVIRNKGTGTVAELPDTSNGTGVVGWQGDGGQANQQWILLEAN